MPRLVALDVGDATVGVAASDELFLTAAPVKTLRRTLSIKADVRAVDELLAELDACKVIVGLPLDAEGNDGPQAEKVRDFANRLARRIRIPLEFWDERFSTVEATDVLIEADRSRRKRREVIDAVAAAVILRSYMNENGA